MKLVIVQPGQKLPALEDYPGDFADWVLRGMGLAHPVAKVVRPHLEEPLPPAPDAVVITGSSAMVTDRTPWIGATASWLRELVGRAVPVLGICFGHQLLAYALGGEVRDNPQGVEVGTVTTRFTPVADADRLCAGLGGEQRVQASHRQSVTRLPSGAVLLAASAKDPHHAFRVGGCAWGLQFHPEFDRQIVTAYTHYYRTSLEEQGEDARVIAAAAQETPRAARLLARFAQG
jgi:GMP synthase (glutamine-hydrolysing)